MGLDSPGFELSGFELGFAPQSRIAPSHLRRSLSNAKPALSPPGQLKTHFIHQNQPNRGGPL
jgi:hypothetical protein